jgi:8-oxo-dGTP pyrophosphatase MutT (NUDIX family)
MRITDLFESEDYDDQSEHFDALHRTGFFGAAGAGCIFVARSTGRILIAHRSDAVEQPGTWGGWGGAINRGEDPAAAVRREVSEEAGYHGHYDLIPLYVFAKNTFRYYNFLVEVDDEFTPELDWETQGYVWCEFGRWPKPLHFGLVALFSDPASVRKIKDAVMQSQSDFEA